MRMQAALFRSSMVAVALLMIGSTAAGQQRRPPAPTTGEGASTSTNLGSISGRVVLPSGHPVTNRVKITLSTAQDPGLVLYTDTNGQFTFNNLKPGVYSLEAQGEGKNPAVAREEVNMLRGMRIMINLTLRDAAAAEEASAKKPAVVSVSELDTNVPAEAKKEYEKGTRLVNENRIEEAIERFKHALAIYPPYIKARNDLGVQYLKLRRLDDAVEQFEAALEVNDKAFNPRLNLGLTMVEQKKYLEARKHLELAVAMDSSSPAAHLYLGIAALEIEELDIAARELGLALSLGGPAYVMGHYYMALVHLKQGERDKALQALKTYIEQSPDSEHVQRARALYEQIANAPDGL